MTTAKQLPNKPDFKMDCEYWTVKITSGDADKVVVDITFKEKCIPETELRSLEQAIRQILIATGRYTENPSKR